MSDSADETVARERERWTATFGVSSSTTTDPGTQSDSHLFFELTNLLGANRIRTTAYHPRASKLVELFHCQLKAALIAHCTPERWTEASPVVLLDIRTLVKVDL